MRLSAQLAKVGDDGVSARSHYEQRAAKGSPSAIATLAAADACPEELEYLRAWAYALYGRSGVGMSGFAPLSFGTIADWARLMCIDPKPHEIEALFVLDAILRDPDVQDKAKEAEAKQHAGQPKRTKRAR